MIKEHGIDIVVSLTRLSYEYVDRIDWFLISMPSPSSLFSWLINTGVQLAIDINHFFPPCQRVKFLHLGTYSD